MRFDKLEIQPAIGSSSVVHGRAVANTNFSSSGVRPARHSSSLLAHPTETSKSRFRRSRLSLADTKGRMVKEETSRVIFQSRSSKLGRKVLPNRLKKAADVIESKEMKLLSTPWIGVLSENTRLRTRLAYVW